MNVEGDFNGNASVVDNAVCVLDTAACCRCFSSICRFTMILATFNDGTLAKVGDDGSVKLSGGIVALMASYRNDSYHRSSNLLKSLRVING